MFWRKNNAENRLERLEEALQSLQTQVFELKKQMENQDLNWSEMRARCKRMLDRTEKAYQQLQEAEAKNAPDSEDIPPSAPQLGLTPSRAERIREQLAARRGKVA